MGDFAGKFVGGGVGLIDGFDVGRALGLDMGLGDGSGDDRALRRNVGLSVAGATQNPTNFQPLDSRGA